MKTLWKTPRLLICLLLVGAVLFACSSATPAAPVEPIATMPPATSTPTPTAIPTTAPTPTILNPIWVEIPLPQKAELVGAIRQENDTLYLGGCYGNCMVANGLWKSTDDGLSWELLSEDPASLFPEIKTGNVFRTIKEKDGVEAKLAQAEENNWDSWVLQMTRDGENWVTIRFPPISGFMPEDFSYDFVVKNDEITIYLTGGKVWQTTINLP